jgi:archaellum component FlaC
VALFSEDLRRLQELEERYRRELSEYEALAIEYRTLLDRHPHDPELPKLYESVESKSRQVQETWNELDRLRRSLGPISPAR